jgi:hypothetical protein
VTIEAFVRRDCVADIVKASRGAQGLPPTVEDERALERVAAVIASTTAPKTKRRALTSAGASRIHRVSDEIRSR